MSDVSTLNSAPRCFITKFKQTNNDAMTSMFVFTKYYPLSDKIKLKLIDIVETLSIDNCIVCKF